MTQKIIALASSIALAAGTFFLSVFLLRSQELGELRELFSRRGKRPVAEVARD